MRRPLCSGLLCFLVLYLAAVFCLQGSTEDGSRPERLSGEEVLLSGKADRLYEPADQLRENRTFRLKEVSVLSENSPNSGEILPASAEEETGEKLNEDVLCYLDAEAALLPKAGSRVRVKGKLTAFASATNPGEFDAAAYYGRQGYGLSLRHAVVEFESADFHRLENALYQLRGRIGRLFIQIFGEKDGEVASAMVLGMKKGLDKQVKALYDGASISHLLVVSGLHLSLIGMGIFWLLRKCRMPLGPAALLAAAFLILYGGMTGMGVSTLRALFMYGLLLGAKLMRRTADVLTSLTVAACAILLPRPQLLLDAGFFLSFSAVAGAAIVVPVLQDRGLRAEHAGNYSTGVRRLLPPAAEALWEKTKAFFFQGITASLGITLFMLPFLLSVYRQWNPWAILANLVVIPLMGLLLPQLFFLAAAGLALFAIPGCMPGGMAVLRILALPAKGIFFLYEKICTLVTELPGSCLHTGQPAGWQLLLFAAGLLLLLLAGKKLPPFGRNLLAFALSGIFLLRLPQPMQVTMLDVGQGECVYLETPAHHVWLLDAGSSSKSKTGQYQIVPFLRYEGVRRLEGILISHWDDDHINGLEDIFAWAQTQRIEIGGLYLPDIRIAGEAGLSATEDGTRAQDENLARLWELAERYGIRVQTVRAGESLQDGQMRLRCLYPYAGAAVDSRNAASAVYRLEYSDFSALFTGDLEEGGEQWLAAQYRDAPGKPLDCDLLDLGHHGAENATTEELLAAVSARAALISCGRNNRYGHPAQQTLARLEERKIPYYVTAWNGAVTVSIEEGSMEISAFCR